MFAVKRQKSFNRFGLIIVIGFLLAIPGLATTYDLPARLLKSNQVAAASASGAAESLGAAPEASPNAYAMSPGQALGTGKPTLFYFYPVEMCQIRYCRQAVEITGRLQTRFGDGVNFVQVDVHAVQEDGNVEQVPMLPYTNWDLYPVLPFTNHLPQPTKTAVGLTLEAPTVMLVNSDGQMAFSGSEFFAWDDLAAPLSTLLGD